LPSSPPPLKARGDKTPPPYPGPKKPGVYLVDKELTQASIQVGFPGVQRPHPDYYKLTLANYIFGSGGFTSRLALKVRTEAGLAYSVRSFVQSSYYRRGTVGFRLQTKTESGTQAIQLCFAEMQKLIKEGATIKELQAAKDALILSLPSLFDTPNSIASIFAQSEIWNRDKDHFVNYPKIISSITLDDVNEIFKKYFVRDSARIVVVGPKKVLWGETVAKATSLSQFGDVQMLSTDEIEKRK